MPKLSSFRNVAAKVIIEKRAIDAFQNFKVSQAMKNERKAVKVLGIVLVIFLIAWVPFAILNILSASCRPCNINPIFLDIFVWLGYISSGINPMVYNAFNNKFRRTYKKIVTLKFNAI